MAVVYLVIVGAFLASALPAEASPLANYDQYYAGPAPYSPPQAYSPPPPPPTYYNQPPTEYYSPPPPPPVYYTPSQPEYYNPPPPVYYAPPPPVYYSPPPPPEYYTKEEVVSYQELNVSIHCGILSAVNADLYKDTYVHRGYDKSYAPYGTALLVKDDVVPFGLYPWVVQITDENNNYLCAGTLVRSQLILTLASCVQGQSLDKLRVRYGDWDVLSDVNEYEVYKNYDTKICRSLPVTCPSSGYSAPESYGQLTLLQVELPDDYDLYPHTKPICLPEWPYNPPAPAYTPPPPPPAYSSPPAQNYNAPPPSYSLAPATYSPQVYSPQPSYSPPPPPPPPAYSPPENYAECWVEGYYASPTVELKTPPQNNDAYSYPAKDYNPYPTNSYTEQSKIPRRAQVKRIQSPTSYQPPSAYGYQAAPCDEEQQWIGVNGYDACVADRGSAIICLVPEYQSTYDETPYQPKQPQQQQQYAQPPQYEAYPSTYSVKLAAAQAREPRLRAVVVAVVKTPTQCTEYEQYASAYGNAGNPYEKQQSKPITAVKVTDNVVEFLLDKYWEGALDYSCPAPKTYYVEAVTPAPYTPPPTYYTPPPPPAYYSPPTPTYYAAPPPPTYYTPPPTEYLPPQPAYYTPPPPPPPEYASPPPTYYTPSPPPPEYTPPPPPPSYYSSPQYSAPVYTAPPAYVPPTYSSPQYY